MRKILIIALLSGGVGAGAIARAGEASGPALPAPLADRGAQVEILRLRKLLAEAVMENLNLRHQLTRMEWKIILQDLGEPDPDAPAKGKGDNR